MDAFDFATALGLGLEALPIHHRPATHSELLARGFVAEDLWRYMRLELDREVRWGRRLGDASVRRNTDGSGWVISGPEDGSGNLLYEAKVSDVIQGIGVLWWIEVRESARSKGIGTNLLATAVGVLQAESAHEVILYIDDDDPTNEQGRSRVAASHMYERAGFVEVDRLVSYHLQVSSRP